MRIRHEFQKWLANGNAKQYSPEVILSCIDRISDYAARKKIAAGSLWEYTNHEIYKHIYQQLLEAKLLRITCRNTHKMFSVAGRLYLRFLKEKPFAGKTAIAAVADEKKVESTIAIESSPQSAIDPEDVIAWLVTQPNANGALYLENVVRKYMGALRSSPAKLQIPAVLDARSLFTCHTPDELNVYWGIFKSATNYKQVNSSTSGMFSAGMACYMRYLQHITDVVPTMKKADEPKKPQEAQPSRVVITYEPKDGAPVQTAQTYLRPVYSAPAVQSESQLDATVIAQLTDVLSSRFANGYRLNSPIESARFRSFAAEDLGEEISLTDDELKNYIAACGTAFDGKIYAVSAQTKERIKELAEECFTDGARAIFFAEFYAKNESWLFEASVVSEDILIGILRGLFPKLSFTQTYFGYTDASVLAALECEILRVWGDDVLLNYDQLAKRLQYIPIERIKYALGQSGDFIWSGLETFSHISRIDITDGERETIREAAVRECNARGYVSITNLPFKEIVERNYELSVTAVHNAVYRICLSDKFDKKGKIVTRKGVAFDALTIMKEYCRTIDKCSLGDLLSFEKELTGEVHRWIPMEAGNAILVRVDIDAYVADRYARFNAEAIDEAIGLFVKGDYLPLKSFTAFGAFPDCGQTWNLFLLESYCRRFSRKFRFDAPAVNSRNAGAVIRKNCGMTYTEIMADAAAKAGITLNGAVVCKFLYESGYTGKSTTAKVGEIIDKAKTLRERRD
jgi:hypothetical protein